MVFGVNIESKEEYEEACREQPLIEPRLTHFWKMATRAAEQRGWTIGIDFMIKVYVNDIEITFSFLALSKSPFQFRIDRYYPWIRNLYYGGVAHIQNLISQATSLTWELDPELCVLRLDRYSIAPDRKITLTLGYICRKIVVENMSKRKLLKKCRKALLYFNSLPAHVWAHWWKPSGELKSLSRRRVNLVKSLFEGYDFGCDWINALKHEVGPYKWISSAAHITFG